MTDKSLATKLAILEGVEQTFDSMVASIIKNTRQASMKRMVGVPGKSPSLIANDMKALDGAIEKMEANLRDQYQDFLSAYVSVRAKLFSADDIAKFIAILELQGTQDYLNAVRIHQKELIEAVSGVTKTMVARATGATTK